MLRIEVVYIGFPCDFLIYDETDREEVIDELGAGSVTASYRTKHVPSAIQRVKTDASFSLVPGIWTLKPLLLQMHSDLAGLATKYQEVLMSRHAFDFVDLILMVCVMLRDYPSICHRWANRYDFSV